jgi:plastocyanin
MMIRELAPWLVMSACLSASPAMAGDLHATVYDDGGKPLPDAVVVAYPDGFEVAPPEAMVEVEDQINKEFVPYVKPVHIGTLVRFPNKDDISHHVYSFSAAKRFELPLYKGSVASPVMFEKAGVVKLGCNIHDWMVGYIYVTDAPFFGKSAAQGSVTIAEMPAGTYRVRVWHPRMAAPEDSTARRIVMQGSAPAVVEWRLKLNREFRPQRTPLPGEPGYP